MAPNSSVSQFNFGSVAENFNKTPFHLADTKTNEGHSRILSHAKMVNTTHNETENDGETYVTIAPHKFELQSRLTVDQKIGILASDSVFVPITLGGSGEEIVTKYADQASKPAEMKQVYLVHLEVSKMAVTVYTNEEFAEEKDTQQTGNDDDQDSLNSDELDADADEFSGAQQRMGT